MQYSAPSYVSTILRVEPRLAFKWDDWRASLDFETDAEPYWLRMSNCTLRAKTALAIGVFEWVIWRFRRHFNEVEPFQLAEAAWCANVNTAYLEYDEFDREEWLGPIRGPIWCAMTWLIPTVLLSDEDPDQAESGVKFLIRLAFHVVPSESGFATWLDQVIDRLTSLYPAEPLDPFDDLFNQQLDERRGPLVPREALDLAFKFEPEMTHQLVDSFLRSVDYTANQFVKTPKVLAEEGFPGTPYRV